LLRLLKGILAMLTIKADFWRGLMAVDFDVRGDWRTEDYGHIYTAKAVTKSGRILAVVNIEVPLDVEIGMRDRFGDDWVEHVEQAAQEQVTTVAHGWDIPADAAKR
jgi:hypothetical protein